LALSVNYNWMNGSTISGFAAEPNAPASTRQLLAFCAAHTDLTVSSFLSALGKSHNLTARDLVQHELASSVVHCSGGMSIFAFEALAHC
jgi:hypothetical protein